KDFNSWFNLDTNHSFALLSSKTDELKQIIKEVIKEEILEVKNKLEKKDSEILMTRQETCKFLKIDSSTLWSWTNKGKIACYGIGNRRYYKKEDLLNSLVLLKVKRA
uniref:helix-turn-helix domain-containing protein n=1 Tax=Flavobacterium sp. TaxID=239 RepID=UPI0040486E3B